MSTSRLRPGMVAAMPVPHPMRSETHLVQEGVALTQEMIGRLADLQVPYAWVKHPLLKDLDGLILSRVPEQRRAIYDSIKVGFDTLQNSVITTQDYQRYRQVIADLVTELLGRNAKAGDLAERLFSDGDELASHSSNVAYLAVTVGMHLETYIARQRAKAGPTEARDLSSLGVGAMLHDMGKLQCAAEHRRQHEAQGARADDYRRHAIAGYEALREKINPVASTVALHHHQRWDGAGWPDMTDMTHGRYTGGMSGARVHIFARIVAAANVFDNLTSGGGSRSRSTSGSGMPAIYALHTMRTQRWEGAFDPVVLDAFLRYVPPFPTGVEVVLSDGRPAAVVAINPDQPCRPVVRPLDEHADGGDLDLAEHPEVSIRESQGHRVTKWLYDLPPRIEALTAAESAAWVAPVPAAAE